MNESFNLLPYLFSTNLKNSDKLIPLLKQIIDKDCPFRIHKGTFTQISCAMRIPRPDAGRYSLI